MNVERKHESPDTPTNLQEGEFPGGDAVAPGSQTASSQTLGNQTLGNQTLRNQASGNQQSTYAAEPTLSTQQCAELAGVSLDTIEKYVAIGLLTPIPNVSGDPQYRQSDIRSLFYTRKSMRPQIDAELPTSFDLAQDRNEGGTQALDASQETVTDRTHDDQWTERSVSEAASSSAAVDSPSRSEAVTFEATQQTDEAAYQQSALSSDSELDSSTDVTPQSAESPATAEVDMDQKPQIQSPSHESSGQSNNFKDSIDAAHQEARNEGPNTRAVQNALREQIEVLKQERDWLRTRVEQLELRGEREQMLLLSESETIRRLVSQRSFTDRVLQTLRLSWVQPDRK